MINGFDYMGMHDKASMTDRQTNKQKTKEGMLVSVIVPVYNVDEYIRECIDSLLSQTYSNIEIILVDDGSTDNSGSICEEYAKEDSRVIVIHKENGGLSSARNAGMEIMRGDYCCFVDSDDAVAVTFIDHMIGLIHMSGADFSACSYTRDLNEMGAASSQGLIEADAHKALEFIFSEKTMTTSAWGKLYRADLWTDIRFPEGYIYEDYATVYKVIMRCEKIIIAPEKLVFYRPNPESITGTGFYEKRMQYFEISDELRPVIEKTFPDLLTYVDNRTVRYAISYYRQIAASGYKNEETTNYLKRKIKTGITQYLRSGYSPLSKAYGILIIISPRVAALLFSNR